MNYQEQYSLKLVWDRMYHKIRIYSTSLFFLYLIIINRSCKINLNQGTRKILLINTGDLGDNILTFNFLDALLLSNKYAVTVIVKNPNEGIYNKYNDSIKVIPWLKDFYKFNFFYKYKFIKIIRKNNYDIAYNLTPESGFLNEEITLLSGANEFWKNDKPAPYLSPWLKSILDKKYHRRFRCNSLNEYEILDINMNLIGLKKHTSKISIKNNNHCTICFAPFSSDKERDWSLVNYNNAIDELSKFFNINILGTPAQFYNFKEFSNRNVRNLCGKLNLQEVLTLIGSANLFIGNDSGLTHAALYCNTPLIAVTGGGMYNRFYQQIENKKRTYLYHKMECFGCGWKCVYKERYCISKVLPEELLKMVYKLLKVK